LLVFEKLAWANLALNYEEKITIPLTYADIGEENVIKKVGGLSETKKTLGKSWFCCRKHCNDS